MKERIKLKRDESETVSYIIPQYPVKIKTSRLSNYHNYRAVSHWHEDLEFICILSGEMQYDINGKVVLLKEGEGLMVNSRNFHYGFSEERKECEFIYAVIHPSLMAANQYIEEKFVRPLIECSELPYLLLGNSDWGREILKYLTELADLDQGCPEFFIESQVYIVKMFELLYKHNISFVSTHIYAADKSLVQLRRMVHYIQEHFCENLTLEDIAREGEMCKTSCSYAFKEYMHTTPFDYLLTYRMEKSLRLLTETDLTITEIAYAVGFHDSSYFAKYFKKYYEMTPREMRKNRSGSFQ